MSIPALIGVPAEILCNLWPVVLVVILMIGVLLFADRLLRALAGLGLFGLALWWLAVHEWSVRAAVNSIVWR